MAKKTKNSFKKLEMKYKITFNDSGLRSAFISVLLPATIDVLVETVLLMLGIASLFLLFSILLTRKN